MGKKLLDSPIAGWQILDASYLTSQDHSCSIRRIARPVFEKVVIGTDKTFHYRNDEPCIYSWMFILSSTWSEKLHL